MVPNDAPVEIGVTLNMILAGFTKVASLVLAMPNITRTGSAAKVGTAMIISGSATELLHLTHVASGVIAIATSVMSITTQRIIGRAIVRVRCMQIILPGERDNK